MPSPERDRAWKTAGALIVVTFAIGICWFVQKRAAAPPPPHVSLPYEPPPSPAK